MNLRQAAQQALEALERINAIHYLQDLYEALDWEIDALRAALAEHDRLESIEAIEKDAGIHVSQQDEPEQEPVAWHHPECEGACIACLIERAVQEAYGSQGLAYLQQHLVSQPQPAPMGWITAGQHTRPLRTHWEGCEAVHPECRKPEQEPVAWFHNDFGSLELSRVQRVGWKPLYTAPIPRKPLTAEEVFEIADQHPVEGFDPEIMAFVRAIERAHGIGEQT